MPARCHFNSGFAAHVRATEGQITNNEPILMGVNTNPVSLEIHSTVESVQRVNGIYQCTSCRPPIIHYVWYGGKYILCNLFDIAVQIGRIGEM